MFAPFSFCRIDTYCRIFLGGWLQNCISVSPPSPPPNLGVHTITGHTPNNLVICMAQKTEIAGWPCLFHIGHVACTCSCCNHLLSSRDTTSKPFRRFTTALLHDFVSSLHLHCIMVTGLAQDQCWTTERPAAQAGCHLSHHSADCRQKHHG